jgi:uncharacterized repeat protein (TIGR01451 family)
MVKISTKEITGAAFVLFCLTMLFGNARVSSHLSFNYVSEEKKSKASPEQQKINSKASEKLAAFTPPPPPANVLVNNNAGATPNAYFTQSESSILAFGSNVLIAFNDAGSHAGGANKFTGFVYSADGGATFTDGGTLPNNALGDAGDPVLARNNTTGRIYLSTLAFNFPYTVQIFRSDNNGVTWMPPVMGTPGGNNENKPWMTVDNYAGAGNGNVYLMSRRYSGALGIHFFRSVDHGTSFGPVGGIPLGGPNTEGAFVTVGPDHSVYAFFYESGTIKMRKSTDLGLTFGAPVTVTGGLIGGANGDLGLIGIRQAAAPAPFRTNEFPHAAVNPVSGHIYVTYANDGAGTDKADVFFKTSIDGGLTWSAPVKVNDDATLTDQWQPTISVTPDGLNLGVFYYSRQEDPATNNLFKYYSRVATIAGATVTFGFSAAVSTVASLPEFGRDAVVNSSYMGDYDQAAATADGFFVSWSDSRNDLTIGLPRKDPNVYFTKIPVTGIPPVSNLNFLSAALSGGDGNGTIDFGETVNITVALNNVGGATATGITSALSTNTPGINITQASSAYADINSLGSGNNTTAFTITTTADYTCSPVAFALTVNYNDGPEIFNFIIPGAGVAGSPVSFSNNTPTPITDLNTTDIPITVSGFAGVIAKVGISLHLTHTFDGDLRISLISPDGTSVALSTQRGGSGDNYGTSCSGRTIFDDAAVPSITSAVAPFVGTFKPEGTLSSFIGKAGTDVNGTWKLRIVDAANLDVGTFQCATLTLTPFTCPTPTGADLQITKSAASTITADANLTYTIIITNTGPSDATAVNLVDALPVNTSFISFAAPPGWIVSTPAVGAGGTVTALNTALAVSGTAIFTLVVHVDAALAEGVVISNIATVTGGEDNNSNNNTATATTTIGAPCSLTCPADIVVVNDPGQCGAIVNFNAPQSSGTCGTVTASPASGSLFPFGTTTVTFSSTTGASCTFNVTVNPATAFDCAITGRTAICDVETVQWCAPAGMTDYEWNGPNQFKVFTRCATITTPGLYTVAFTDGNGCRKSCSQELQATNCPAACTYTQGFYGNKKGMACYTSNNTSSSISSTQLMLHAFGATTSKVFGNVANKQFFTLYKTNITNGDIFKMLPGMGNSLALGVDAVNPFDGAYYSDDNTWYLVPIPKNGSQKGRINNMLLAQLMTLWFNIETSAPLGTISLTEDTLVTQAQTICGSGVPTGTIQKYGLPHSVILYLNGGNGYSADVNGLFVLANDVLGGVNTSISAPEVQLAIATINDAFDRCRVLTGTLPYVTPLLTRTQKNIIETAPPDFSVTAYPNPSSSMFNIQVSTENFELITITVSDLLGRMIETRNIVPNETVQIGQKYRRGVYIIQIIQGREYKQMKLVKLNE